MKRLFIFILFLVSTLSVAQKEYALAENYFRNNEFEKALQIYKKLNQKNPYNTTYLERLVTTYQELEKFKQLDSLLVAKQHKYPKLTFINVLLGHNLERQQQPEKAHIFYRKAINSIKKHPEYTTIIAKFLKNYNQLDLAILAYNVAEENNPKRNFDFEKAQIYGEKGNFDLMFASYIDLVNTKPNYYKTVQRYAASYITDNPEEITNIAFKKALLRKSASNPKPAWNNLLSWLFVKQKQYNKAFVQQKALYTRNPDNISGIKELGKIAFENNDFETTKKCFQFILEKTQYVDEKINAHWYFIKMAIAQKEANIETQFKELFKTFGKNQQTLPIQILYADYLTFSKNKPTQAKIILDEAQNYAKNKFQKARVKLKLADVLVFTGSFNKALIYFSQVQTRLKNHTLAQEARFKVARTSYFKGDFNWAKTQLKVLKSASTQLIANDAVDLFLTISDNQPKDSVPTGLKQLAKAALLTYQNKNTAALKIIETIFTDFKGQPIEYEALFEKGKILLKQAKHTAAIKTFTKLISNNPEGIYNDDAYYKIAEIYKSLNNTKQAQEYYQKIIFEYPNSIYLVDARKKYRKLRGDTI